MTQPIVVAGASGFVGRNLVNRLLADGRTVRCGSRDPDRAAARSPDRTWVKLDVDQPATLPGALEGADTLVYLVHHLGADGDLTSQETRAATQVREACVRAGVRRIVYLGGPEPDGTPSKHLRSRLLTGSILRNGDVSTIELRAGMIIGNGSESWQIVRDLSMRLPAMVLPAWLKTRTQPVALDDVVAAIVAAIDLEHPRSGWYDLPGPETLAARDILLRIAAQRNMHPVMVDVPLLTPRLSSWWLRFVTRADYGIARQLVDGLTSDMVSPPEHSFYEQHMPGFVRTSFDRAVGQALEAEETPGLRGRVWEGLAVRVARRPRLAGNQRFSQHITG